MPEILPDLTDTNRCVSVHWSLPVQCMLPRTHAEIWHEAWHPQTGNRMRYRRTMGVYVTEELHDGQWHDLAIPAPGVVCGEPHSSKPGVFCQLEHGKDGKNENTWNHFSLTDGCHYTWHTPPARKATVEQLEADVTSLRAEVERLQEQLTKACNDLDGARLGRWEEEQDNLALSVERHSTNEEMSKAIEDLHAKDQQLAAVRDAVAEAIMCGDHACLTNSHLPKLEQILGGVGLLSDAAAVSQ